VESLPKRSGWPWWAWLVIILFPVPIGIGPWWVAAIFLAAFALVIWAMLDHFKNDPSE
jgi:hypothetical protein